MRRSALIYNPAAGHRRQRRLLAALLPELARGGFDARPVPTGGPGDATRLAAEAVAGGTETIFVLGGDGTVREAATALVGGTVPLAVLPAGTANVLAHALGLPPDPHAAARIHAGSRVRQLDVGLCGDKPFLMMASGGFDAFVLDNLDLGLKARLGKVGIVVQALMELRRYRYPALELEVDGEVVEASLFVVCNIPFYGGGFRLVPEARFDDRRLDLVTFRGSGWTQTLSFGLDLVRGTHLARDDVEARPVERLVVRAPESASVQIDGDPSGLALPVEIRLAERTIPVLAPMAG
jgi:YegS/Rv2252/BmrU family lipid kinase